MVNQLPQGWKEEELGKLADVSSGDSAPQSSSCFLNGSYPFCRTSDVGKIHRSSNFSEIEDYINETAISKLHLFHRGTILFPKSGASTLLNHRVMLSIDSYVSSHLATIYANSIDRYYLYYFLCTVDAKQLVPNLDYPSLKISELKNIKVPYPTDKGEQDYIVKTLDAVAEMIKLRKETIQLTKDLIPAIFHEMFGDPITNPKGWDKKNLGQVCDVRSGNAFPERYQGYTNGKPFYKVGDISRTIEENHIYLDKAKNYITDEIAQIIKAKSFSKNTIVFAKVGEALRLNRRALISKDAFIDNNVMGVSIKEDCNDLHYLYLYYHFVCNINLNFIKKEGAIPSVNNKDINNLYLPIPPLSLQKDFAKKVEQINDYIIAQQEELEQFETLFQSLLQEAFTGVLTWKYPRKECHDKKDQ